MPKKKTKEVKEVIPFQIPNVKNYNVWFVKLGRSAYFRLQPVPYKLFKPDIGKFKIHFYVGFYRYPAYYLYPKT